MQISCCTLFRAVAVCDKFIGVVDCHYLANNFASMIPSSVSYEAYAQTEGNNTSALWYTDPSSGITFQYPSSGKFEMSIPHCVLLILFPQLVCPTWTERYGFIDNVIINVNNVSNTTLGQYTEEALAQYNNVSDVITITNPNLPLLRATLHMGSNI